MDQNWKMDIFGTIYPEVTRKFTKKKIVLRSLFFKLREREREKKRE